MKKDYRRHLLSSCIDAVAKINRFYFRYHSIGYIGNQVVLRLASAIDQDLVNEMKASFSEMLTPGGDMILSGPLPAERDEPEIAHLQRLVVDFNRHNLGWLKQLIDAVNEDI